MKRLHVDDNSKANFDKETEMLKRFGGRHPNIVTLLATITCKVGTNVEYYLLFPWAEGDLKAFWQSGKSRWDHETVKWVSSQCRGIVEAVAFIHNPGYKNEDGQPMFGRHGDIKPENVLWFKRGGMETLVLSDLGIAAVHKEISRSAQPPTMATTLNYKPPEHDMDGPQGWISRSFDIWTLGCLFLEFMVWTLSGWSGRKSFKDELMSPYTSHNLYTDMYFEVLPSKTPGKHVFKIKDKVTEVR